MHSTPLHQSQGMERGEHNKWNHGHSWAFQTQSLFPWTPGTCTNRSKGNLRNPGEKAVSQNFASVIYFVTYYMAISTPSRKGWEQTWSAIDFRRREKILQGMNPFPKKPNGVHLLVTELCRVAGSQGAGKDLSKQVFHTSSELLHSHTNFGWDHSHVRVSPSQWEV